jgi:hypothetical protein
VSLENIHSVEEVEISTPAHIEVGVLNISSTMKGKCRSKIPLIRKRDIRVKQVRNVENHT